MLVFNRMEPLVKRNFWINLIEKSWEHRSITWLSGVRRSGKTSLTQTLDQIEYFDCELPRTRQMMAEPEGFLTSLDGHRIILDEIHRLRAPAELLKIAADHFPKIKVLATGSSTLGASRKFRDTLTGRKTNLWLTPMIQEDLAHFPQSDLTHRLRFGGLPPFFLNTKIPEKDFQEWLDDYWAKDIQDLFRLNRRDSFQRFAELVMARSGGIFEATRFTAECEVSRVTIRNYLRVLEETLIAHVIRPFNSHKSNEIIAAPKVYAFDTGFVSYHKGWNDLRNEDLGLLWEHYVLNELQAHLQTRDIRYWRDKQGHEIDFILASRHQPPTVIECKWNSNGLDPKNILIFRRQYPHGKNFVVCSNIDRSYIQKHGVMSIHLLSLKDLIKNFVSS
ncbi:MAG: ATP-binding protein [Candidatus Omnitrophica bacterium]|nr:ATP-binding protein [Candidatus Omnitrophota bacterium]